MGSFLVWQTSSIDSMGRDVAVVRQKVEAHDQQLGAMWQILRERQK